jgi:hypothetical protein
MIRSYLVINLSSLDYLPMMDRWLYKNHASETMSQVGPILHRYATYRAVPGPEGSEAFCVYNWRMTEHWWAESPFKAGAMGHGSAISEVWPKDYNKAVCIPENEEARGRVWKAKAPAFVFVNPRPTEDFLGRGLRLEDGNIIRWVTVHKYPEGVSREEGDKWYNEVHASEVCKQPGLKRFFSFSAVDPTPMIGPFVRVSELWYENHSAWKNAIIDNPTAYTKPAWAKHDKYPFLEPGVDFVSQFLLERPECDFLKDYRGYNITA